MRPRLRDILCLRGMPRDGHKVEENRRLLIMVSYYDHKTGMVPRPRILLVVKRTPRSKPDAGNGCDGPTVDLRRMLWDSATFVHLPRRGAVLHRLIRAGCEKAFSWPQPWYLEGRGFVLFYTVYDDSINRLCAISSKDGMSWSEPTVLAAIEAGHSQVSWRFKDKVGTAFEYFPRKRRSMLVPISTTWRPATSPDMGECKGEKLDLPLTTVDNKAMVQDYAASGRLIFVKDVTFDTRGNPIILYMATKSHRLGPLAIRGPGPPPDGEAVIGNSPA